MAKIEKVFLNKYYQLALAVILIIFVPVALLIHNYFFVNQVKETLETEYINKAALVSNILAHAFQEKNFSYDQINQDIKKIVEENSEIIALDVLSPEKNGDFKIVASIDDLNLEKNISQTLNNIAWQERFITFSTKSGANSSDQTLTRQDFEADSRYQMIVKVMNNAEGDKTALLSMKISLKEIDDLLSNLIKLSYFTLVILILFILFLFLTNLGLFERVVLYEKLKSVDQMKDEFISIASHELRTPVTAIRGYASMILEMKPEKKIKEMLETVISSANRLNTLVEDMLNVSRIEQKRLKVEAKPQESLILIDQVIKELESSAKEKKLGLQHLKEAGAEVWLNIDADRFKQILVNLIGNSIKYTEKGKVDIITEKDEKEKRILIKVKDTGIGMSAKAREKLFQKFYRVQNEKTQQIQGTGLGLWITKQLIEMMKGEIFVDSIEGQGTVFTISFPLSNKPN